ncbi:MAG TPA: PilZ domain-containing protein [Geobacteraceae bacterium]|nr:PilZ domain-containing protein [Geobacteraceae bacterium]
MFEKRRFHRIRFMVKSDLTHNNINYPGRLENISLNGALISFSDGVVVPRGEECILMIHLEDENTPLRLVVEVIYSNFTMIGIKLITTDVETRLCLRNLLERLTSEPDKLSRELQQLDRECEE